MRQGIKGEHFCDNEGNPAGGKSTTNGAVVNWQNGPLGRGEDRQEPNGAFVEDIIDIARDRIQYYQNSKFNCRENAIAITKLEEAMQWLNWRTADRETRAVEGTHNV